MGAHRILGRSVSTKLAYVIEPRFSGGTSAAVAAELQAAAGLGEVVVHARTSRMFGDSRHVAPVLRQVLNALRIPLIWDAPEISADLVIFHNPAFLKFQNALDARILARSLVVVTHENFLRPGGDEGFDVSACLGQIDASTLALRKFIAPISPYNRSTVNNWLSGHRLARHWIVLEDDWFNICNTEIRTTRASPQDRRGRHSRPGFEKFPSPEELDDCFPEHALANVILGADALLDAEVIRPHWKMLPFDAVSVEEFFDMIDFFVYFTTPTWRESFGRVIAEALAAGKVVLTDTDTGQTFGDAVITCRPPDVDDIISDLIAHPRRYVEQVAKAKPILERYSAQSFRKKLTGFLATEIAEAQ
ncbi:glycosyltransferase [Ruegeria sediminis]|uniref:glycosyltransferase n=1 Tax=Ruegeria sediminis TaxID=2583820 RepID=UPI001FE841A7|nr:hypothetical protein [Ruegeria sediminis]